MPFTTVTSEDWPSSEKNDGLRPCGNCSRDSHRSITPSRLRFWPAVLAVYSIVTTYILLGMTSSFSSAQHYLLATAQSQTTRLPSLYTPFGQGVRYKVETPSPNDWRNDLYMGEPYDESERAWNKLIHPNRQHGIRLYRDEASHLNINKSILLSDDNFAVILSVHHNLHCLRRLRQTFYADHYFPNWTQEEQKHNREHNLHCLESIRWSMICQPDLAPLPYHWSGKSWHDMDASPAVKRECVDWEAFSNYLTERRYEESELVR